MRQKYKKFLVDLLKNKILKNDSRNGIPEITLEKSLNVAKSIGDKEGNLFETVRAGVIQNYKVCYESTWKSMKRWIEFHKARNTTSHVYEVEVADEVYAIAFEYLQYAKNVLKRLEVVFREIRIKIGFHFGGSLF